MPLEAYIEGGKNGWLEVAEKYGTTDKLRDKPYER